MKWFFIPILLAVSTAAFAQSAAVPVDTTQNVTVIVPVVGSTIGVNGVTWKTDVELTNDQPREAIVSLVLPAAPDQPAMITTISPGATVRFTDIVGQAFGMDRALSPLLISTMGRRSVSVRATAYGVRGAEAFRPEPLSVERTDVFFPFRYLPGLSFNDEFRTNIGFANLGEEPATFVIALQRFTGRNVAVARLTLPSNTLWHIGIQFLFPLITKGEDFSALVETSSANTYVYASVIENETNSAKFVHASIGMP
jgi:hypothetical protein